MVFRKNVIATWKGGQIHTLVYKNLHRKQHNEQYEHNRKSGANYGSPELQAVPALLVACVMILLKQKIEDTIGVIISKDIQNNVQNKKGFKHKQWSAKTKNWTMRITIWSKLLCLRRIISSWSTNDTCHVIVKILQLSCEYTDKNIQINSFSVFVIFHLRSTVNVCYHAFT